MNFAKCRVLMKLNCFLLVFLLGRQGMFFLENRSLETGREEIQTEVEECLMQKEEREYFSQIEVEGGLTQKEKREYFSQIEAEGGLTQKEEIEYISQKEEFLSEMQEKLSTSKEEFTVYIPSLWIKTGELNEFMKELFPAVRTGNYYRATVFQLRLLTLVSKEDPEGVVKLSVGVKRTDSKEEQEELKTVLSAVVAQIEGTALNDYEKIKLAHDYLVENVEYVNGYDGAYSALCLGKSVCNGYAAAFQLMMEEMDIPCFMVCNGTISHAWNCVFLDGYWYEMDVTWDDPANGNGEISYRYFLKSKNDFYGHGEVFFSTAAKSFPYVLVENETKSGFIKKENETYYYMNGIMVSGWLLEQGKWYYFNPFGHMQTGWVKSTGTWYYLDESGVMQTGWLRSGGRWYYLDERGAMQTGWVRSGGKWYYLDESGAMQTGWVKSGGRWYYLDKSGAWVSILDKEIKAR